MNMSYFVITMLSSALILSLLDALYHSDRVKALRQLAITDDFRELNRQLKQLGLKVKPYDDIFGPMPYISAWLLIITATVTAIYLDHWAFDCLAIIVIAARMRALQEIGHYALHGALTHNHQFGIWLTNVMCQYPLLLIPCDNRRESHCRYHHPHTNVIGKDPNIDDFARLDFIPGMSKKHFVYVFFRPLLPAGIIEKLTAVVKNLKTHSLSRLLVLSLIVLPFVYSGQYWALVKFYFVPVLIIYPWFAWISQIVEHRWFIKVDQGASIYQRELTYGRPTEYPGLIGKLTVFCLFPYSDNHHLAHSLFPDIRYNYLPILNEKLLTLENYNHNASYGLFFNNKPQTHTAISELYQRLTTEPASKGMALIEIPVSDFDRAVDFYNNILQASLVVIEKHNPQRSFGLLPNGKAGVQGALAKIDGFEPSDTGTRVYLDGGPDLNHILNRVEAAGGEKVQEKTKVEENWYYALFKDSEGNIIALCSPS